MNEGNKELGKARSENSVGNLDNDVPYIEMEYIEGKNLAEILRSHG